MNNPMKRQLWRGLGGAREQVLASVPVELGVRQPPGAPMSSPTPASSPNPILSGF